jgi:hypothetical protein
LDIYQARIDEVMADFDKVTRRQIAEIRRIAFVIIEKCRFYEKDLKKQSSNTKNFRRIKKQCKVCFEQANILISFHEIEQENWKDLFVYIDIKKLH